jgi:hypothetical protein
MARHGGTAPGLQARPLPEARRALPRRSDRGGGRGDGGLPLSATAFSVGHRGALRPFHACHFVVQPNGSGLASIVKVAAVTGC